MLLDRGPAEDFRDYVSVLTVSLSKRVVIKFQRVVIKFHRSLYLVTRPLINV